MYEIIKDSILLCITIYFLYQSLKGKELKSVLRDETWIMKIVYIFVFVVMPIVLVIDIIFHSQVH